MAGLTPPDSMPPGAICASPAKAVPVGAEKLWLAEVMAARQSPERSLPAEILGIAGVAILTLTAVFVTTFWLRRRKTGGARSRS